MNKMMGDLFAVDVRYRLCAGADEVGRGPLAGDVLAAAVILDPQQAIVGLNDSKKLSEKKRNQLSEEIKLKAKAWCIARASVQEIDQLNILQASLLAMKRAVEGLSLQPEFVFVDGNKLPRWSYPSEAVVQGDSKIAEISAASIIAKVARDSEMQLAAEKYPHYGFELHKGYPTALHLRALEKYGPCEIHRLSYAPVKKFVCA